MTRSIYSRLFRYRPDENRAPLENFLTEALADLLNRLPLDAQSDFIGRLGCNHAKTTEIAEQLRKSQFVNWETQYPIRVGAKTKFPDIVLLADDIPLLMVENKVAAGFTTDAVEDDSGSERIRSQLEVYDDWLSALYPDAALVLLTQSTVAPDDFLSATSSSYQLKHRAVCRWKDIHSWLSAQGSSRFTKAGEMTRALAVELAQFLEDTTMVEQDLSLMDLGQYEVIFRLHRSSEALFEEIRRRLYLEKKIWPAPSRKAATKLDLDGGCVWSWHYPAPPRYVGWGIIFPAQSRWDQRWVKTLSRPSGFCIVASDGEPLRQAQFDAQKLPEGWLVSDKMGGSASFGAAYTFNLCDVDKDGSTFVAQFADRICQLAEQGNQILTQCNG
jgi:hypothetical protein